MSSYSTAIAQRQALRARGLAFGAPGYSPQRQLALGYPGYSPQRQLALGLVVGASAQRQLGLGAFGDDPLAGGFYPYLSPGQVDAAVAALTNRANAAITRVDTQRSLLGQFTGNNDTVLSVEGGIKQIRDLQMPMWQQNGYQLAQALPQDPKAISAWASTGQTFAAAITAIDGYGNDAGLDSVLSLTRDATIVGVAKTVAVVAGVGALAYFAYGALGFAALRAVSPRSRTMSSYGAIRKKPRRGYFRYATRRRPAIDRHRSGKARARYLSRHGRRSHRRRHGRRPGGARMGFWYALLGAGALYGIYKLTSGPTMIQTNGATAGFGLLIATGGA